MPLLATSEGKMWKRKRDPQKKNLSSSADSVLPKDSSWRPQQNQVYPEPPTISYKQSGGEENMSSTLAGADPRSPQRSDEDEGRMKRHNFVEVLESSSTLAKFGTGPDFITVDIH